MNGAEYLEAQAKAMTERQLETAVERLARSLAWLAYHPAISQHSTPGYPDLTLVRNGRLKFAELKTMRGKVSDHQSRWLLELDAVAERFTDGAAAVTVHVWRPIDLLDGTIARALA